MDSRFRGNDGRDGSHGYTDYRTLEMETAASVAPARADVAEPVMAGASY